MMEYI